MSDEAQTPEDTGTPEPDEQQPEGATPAEAQNTDTAPTEHMIPKSRFDEINSKLKALESQVKKDEKARKDKERQDAEKQGEFEKLYQTAQAEAETRQKELEELQARLKDAELAGYRMQAAKKHNLPDALIGRLHGDNEEEIEADAQALAKSLPQPVTPAANDATSGTNQNAPTPALTDEEIREFAATYGLNPEVAKQVMSKKQ